MKPSSPRTPRAKTTRPRYLVKFIGYHGEHMVWALHFGGIDIGHRLQMSERMAHRICRLLNASPAQKDAK